MRILGIETSCDETAVCLIEAEGAFGPDFKFRVLGNALHSQVATHAPWGGVFPNLAKREHAKNLVPLLSEVFPEGGATQMPNQIEHMLHREPELFQHLQTFFATHGRPDVDAIAITHGPGLEPALWVGVNFARALSVAWNIPLVGVNHLEGHIAMAAMNTKYAENCSLHIFAFPAVGLLISGGHTEIDVIDAWPQFKTVGETRDDAVGEAFDKVARMLGIAYPGGAKLSHLAAHARKYAENSSLHMLPRPMIHEKNLDFSFSGLKTAVLRLINGRELSDDEKKSIALEFENAVADVLVAKTKRAADEYGARTLLVGGGVSANEFLKQRLAESLDIPVLAPPPEWATDNALMIALAGYFHALQKEFIAPEHLRANGNLRLGTLAA